MAKRKKDMTFEVALKKLESVVAALEAGDLSLEESLRKFEEGMKLSRFCQKKLEDTELKLKKLVEKDGEIELQDMKFEN